MLAAMAARGRPDPVESNVNVLGRSRCTRCVDASMITRDCYKIIQSARLQLKFGRKYEGPFTDDIRKMLEFFAPPPSPLSAFHATVLRKIWRFLNHPEVICECPPMSPIPKTEYEKAARDGRSLTIGDMKSSGESPATGTLSLLSLRSWYLRTTSGIHCDGFPAFSDLTGFSCGWF